MSSGFVSEKDIAEARKRRQEEWEKVRNADQPLECPEEPYDGRSLYDRLKEQKVKKDMEYEEAHKLKNLIRGIDDDEAEFLELVDKHKMDADKKQQMEDEQELKDFRNRVELLQEEIVEKRIKGEIAQPKIAATATTSTRHSQKSLLSAGIKRRNGDISYAAKSPATAQTSNDNGSGSKKKLLSITTNEFDRGQLKCIAVLPGIGTYTDSSDSENSSDSDVTPTNNDNSLIAALRAKKKAAVEV